MVKLRQGVLAFNQSKQFIPDKRAFDKCVKHEEYNAGWFKRYFVSTMKESVFMDIRDNLLSKYFIMPEMREEVLNKPSKITRHLLV